MSEAEFQELKKQVEAMAVIYKSLIKYFIRHREMTIHELTTLDEALGYERTVPNQKERRG